MITSYDGFNEEKANPGEASCTQEREGGDGRQRDALSDAKRERESDGMWLGAGKQGGALKQCKRGSCTSAAAAGGTHRFQAERKRGQLLGYMPAARRLMPAFCQ